MELKLNPDELIKYLCIGQPALPPKDYWVVIMRRYGDGSEYITEVCYLPSYDRKSIFRAAADWIVSKGFMAIEEATYKFTSQEEAEKFRKEKALPALNLSPHTLKNIRAFCRVKEETFKPSF